jgi:tRNA pseudouridine65 synthase
LWQGIIAVSSCLCVNSVAVLPILHIDPWLVAVHKPPGLLVHRTGLDAGETRFAMQVVRDQLGRLVYPVHRLDKGTSGVLLFALTPEVARELGAAFEGRQVHKRYLAFVRGWPPAGQTRVDHPLREEDTAREAPAQPASTFVRRLAVLELPEPDGRHPTTRAALVQAEPHTGRRHQIRRHLKHIAHPVIGDATHGKGPLNRWWAGRLGVQRLWLHALALELPHPARSGETLRIASGTEQPWNEDWQALLARDGWVGAAPTLRAHDADDADDAR